MPLTPSGFQSVSDETNTVVFSGGNLEKARRVLGLIRQCQDEILAFWDKPDAPEFSHGVKVYLCETSEEYYRMTLNRAVGSALMGRVVLNMPLAERRLNLNSSLIHELSHIYLTRRFGWLSKLCTVPNWFDEGCAVQLHEEQWDLNLFLQQRAELASLTDLETQFGWESVTSAAGATAIVAHYAFVSSFVRFLIDHHGMNRLYLFLDSLSFGGDSSKTFEEVFGMPLKAAEARWLSESKRLGNIPQDTVISPLPLGRKVIVKWSIVFALLLLISLWLVRQSLRLARAAVPCLLRARRTRS